MDVTRNGDTAVERCQEHVVADGQVERSKKMDGVVERTRRCGTCGSLFRTFELTDDQMAKQEGEHAGKVRALRRELGFYQRIVEQVKEIYRSEELLRDDLRAEYEYGNEDRD